MWSKEKEVNGRTVKQSIACQTEQQTTNDQDLESLGVEKFSVISGRDWVVIMVEEMGN